VQTFVVLTYPVVAAISVAALVFSVEAVRRIRRLNAAAAEQLPRSGPPLGAATPAFDARSVDGEPMASDHLVGLTAIGFFGATCGPCREHLASFLADTAIGPYERAVIVVVGDAEAGADLVALGRAAECAVLVEPDNGPVSKAYAIRVFPTVVASVDGRVVEVGPRLTGNPTAGARKLQVTP
jgi:hypothetical protein